MTRDTKVIHIYYNEENHYDSITSVTGFRGCSYCCEFVMKATIIVEIITVLMDVTAFTVTRNVSLERFINVLHVNEPSIVRLGLNKHKVIRSGQKIYLSVSV